MTRQSINPGRVDWCGENPGIYLKLDAADENYCLLSLFFRVVLSPYGAGHAAIVLAAPETGRGWPEACNFIITDNQRLMRWIVDGWVTRMPTFVGRAGLRHMSWLNLDSVQREAGDLKSDYREILRGSGVTLEMHWSELGAPLPVEVSVENSATRAHEMYSVFVEAQSASVTVNGSRLPGTVQSRQFFGRSMSTAFLAFSETWVTPPQLQEQT